MPVSMVGRVDELAELAAAWTHLATGPRPRTAIVTGGAGSGKSLLVAAALDALDPAPSVVLFGAARIHTPAPYDWLAALLSTHDTSRVPVPPAALARLAQQPGPEFRYAPDALLRLAVRTVQDTFGIPHRGRDVGGLASAHRPPVLGDSGGWPRLGGLTRKDLD